MRMSAMKKAMLIVNVRWSISQKEKTAVLQICVSIVLQHQSKMNFLVGIKITMIKTKTKKCTLRIHTDSPLLHTQSRNDSFTPVERRGTVWRLTPVNQRQLTVSLEYMNDCLGRTHKRLSWMYIILSLHMLFNWK